MVSFSHLRPVRTAPFFVTVWIGMAGKKRGTIVINEIAKEKSFRDDMHFNSPASEPHTSILQTHFLSVEPKSGVGEGTLFFEEGAVFRCRV
jgi:hypothetical protein